RCSKTKTALPQCPFRDCTTLAALTALELSASVALFVCAKQIAFARRCSKTKTALPQCPFRDCATLTVLTALELSASVAPPSVQNKLLRTALL
ncbi:MAG: hypothetical protein RSD19_03300, partial [Oscillospiraceae bacterium]